MVSLTCRSPERLEKAVGRKITLCAEGLRPGQVQGLFPHIQVGLVELLPSITDSETVLGCYQLLAVHVLAVLVDGRKQRPAQHGIRCATLKLGPQGQLDHLGRATRLLLCRHAASIVLSNNFHLY